MRISDWSSDVCSSDLKSCATSTACRTFMPRTSTTCSSRRASTPRATGCGSWTCGGARAKARWPSSSGRSEEHTSELQSLMRISYAVFCLKKKKQKTNKYQNQLNKTNYKYTALYINITHMYIKTN